MADRETENQENPYIKEKIRRKKHSTLRFFTRVILCVLLAVIFGAVAGFVFVVVKPWAEQIGLVSETEEETAKVASVALPTYVQEESTDESETEPEPSEEPTTIDDEEVELSDTQRSWITSQIDNRIARDTADISDVEAVDDALNDIYVQTNKSLATVSGYSEDEDGESQLTWQVMGLLFYQNEETEEYFILIDASAISDTENIQVQIPTLDETIDGTIKGWDHVYGLAVISVSVESLSDEDAAKISIVEIGNSYQVSACDTVLLIGTPYITYNTVATGRITYVETGKVTLDSVYRLFYTDITLPQGAGGFMINTSGQLVGILTSSTEDALSDYASAIGTEELKGTLNSMINGMSSSLLGVYATDVTEELIAEGMPEGVYVSDVQVDGPAYAAGISAGDIIVSISQTDITSVSELTQCLLEEHLPEETVIVSVMRMSPDGYKMMEISVTLGAR